MVLLRRKLEVGFPKMKKFLVVAALLATTAAAQSADLGRRAPVYKAPIMQVYDWTGFYIGVNAGLGVARDRTRLGIPALPSAEQSHLSPFGAIGGGQIGYNWQINQDWLVGLEADIQASGQRDNYTCLVTCTPGFFRANLSQELDWFGTVRGRVGIVKGPVLSYFTGGVAYGHTSTTVSEAAGILAPASFTATNTKVGYAIGSGVEASLGGNWTGKIEYLYVDLGKQTHNFALLGTPQSVETRIQNNIFRAGLNYRIGAVANYTPPPANWTGFYVGGNAGSLLGRNRSNLSGVGLSESFHLVPDGYAIGGQAGYNWQAAAWVFGIEADVQGAFSRDKDACIVGCAAGTAATLKQTLPWFGTVRGRVGYTLGSTLFYGTGGFAYGQTKTEITETAAGVGTGAATIKRNRGGYAVGAGIETPFELFGLIGPNWTTKTEYLYVDLGKTTDSFTVLGAPQTFSTRTQEHIFRTGINYQFNGPRVARY